MANRTMCVYTITNQLNGKQYVGSTNNIGRRINEHKRMLRKGLHYNKHLQRAYDYSPETLVYKIQGCYNSREDAFTAEQLYLDNHALYDQGYNQQKLVKCSSEQIGHSLRGRSLTEEHKITLSKSRTLNPELCPNCSLEIYQYCKYTYELLTV